MASLMGMNAFFANFFKLYSGRNVQSSFDPATINNFSGEAAAASALLCMLSNAAEGMNYNNRLNTTGSSSSEVPPPPATTQKCESSKASKSIFTAESNINNADVKATSLVMQEKPAAAADIPKEVSFECFINKINQFLSVVV